MYRVFVKTGCASCKNVVSQLNQRGIPYSEIDVGTSEGLKLASELNVTAAGTIIDQNNNKVSLKDI